MTDDYPMVPNAACVNYYRCPNPGCGHAWAETYDHVADSTCPRCNFDAVAPYASDEELTYQPNTVIDYSLEALMLRERWRERRIMRLFTYSLLVTLHGRHTAGANGRKT